MQKQREIEALKELVRVACKCVDRCSAAGRIDRDPYRAMVADQICEDRRLLLIDLVRCLLLLGVPVPAVRKLITAPPPALVIDGDGDLVSADIEIAEQRLQMLLRQTLSDPLISASVQELLSLHYLRLKLHHDEIDDIIGLPIGTDPARLPWCRYDA